MKFSISKRYTHLETSVKALYEARCETRADWSDWLFDNHIFLVAHTASILSERFFGNKEHAMSAALLHDIADSCMKRSDTLHEVKSLQMAEELLIQCGFQDSEIELITQDILRQHSCLSREATPKSLEGRIMATADALVHINSDFYDFSIEQIAKSNGLSNAIQWAFAKIERDFHQKILFPEIQEENHENYACLRRRVASLSIP